MRRDELEFRWEREGSKTWALCVITPAVIDGKMDGYCGFLGKYVQLHFLHLISSVH